MIEGGGIKSVGEGKNIHLRSWKVLGTTENIQWHVLCLDGVVYQCSDMETEVFFIGV